MRGLYVLLGLTLLFESVAAAQTPTSTAGQMSSPAWLQWLGWSDDGNRYALRVGGIPRSGAADSQPRPGAPIDLFRLDAAGQVEDHLHVTEGVREALRARRISVGGVVAREQVTPLDTLLRTAGGQLFAVVARGTQMALLRKSAAGGYEVIERWTARAPVVEVTAFGWEAAKTRRLAIVTTTGPSPTAHLSVVSLATDVTSNAGE
jgi:hypothetical protein